MAEAAARFKAYVSRQTLLAFCIAGIVVIAIGTAARIFVRLWKQRRLFADDYAILLAAGIYFTMCALYIAELPYMYVFYDYVTGRVESWPGIDEEYPQMMRYNFANTHFLWAVLWSVKASLLLFFRRIIQWTDWMRVWWAIVAFTALTYIGAVISQFTSCDAFEDFFVLGQCASERETRAQLASLYYSFAADVLTEVAVMALPLRVILGLKLSRKDKISLVCLFSVGTIAIVVSMIRVFLIWAKTGSTAPSPAWLGLWAVIECMVAILVGCIPVLSQVFRGLAPTSRDPTRGDPYNPYDQARAGTSAATPASRLDRGRKSHRSSIMGTTASEENLFDARRSRSTTTVTSEVELNRLRGRT